ncbi:MAG: hypothetical protein RLZZ210_1431 [Pseudomonadota bacterium]|jgi:hypothetical protein
MLALLFFSILLANLPFIINISIFNKIKSIRLIIWLAFYISLIFFSFFLENQQYGNVYKKEWDFYAITFCIYIILGYPSIIWQYLYKK